MSRRNYMELYDDLKLGLKQAIDMERTEGMLKFGDRKRVVEKYEEWFAEANKENNGTLANNNMTFMAFLTTANLLNTDVIKKFLEE